MSKKTSIILVVTIICFGLLVTGGTYAWLSFGTVINGETSGNSTCFIMDYDYTDDDDGDNTLSGTLFQSSKPKAGLSGSVTMAINSNCDVSGTGAIYMTVNNGTSSTLYSKAKARCENSKTLQTLTNYTSSSTCSSAGGTWVSASSKSALKYAVYESLGSDPVAVGHINGTGDITLYDGFELSYSDSKYYIYIWLDGELVDNTYLDVSFDGDIHLGATQIEKSPISGNAYAVFFSDVGELRFLRSSTAISVGDVIDGYEVSAVYTGFETSAGFNSWLSHSSTYFDSNSVLWYVNVVDPIYPINTSGWFAFSEVYDSLNFDLCNLKTFKVTNMSGMFENLGAISNYSGYTKYIYGLDCWDTSNVTDMSNMFAGAGGDDGINILGIENWDTSNVTNMSNMFANANVTHTLDLSNWNVCRVTNHTDFATDFNGTIIEPNWGMACP